MNQREFRGKHFLIRCLLSLTAGELYLRSEYGPLLRARPYDATWGFAFKGHRKTVVSDEVRGMTEDACFIDIGANIGIYTLLAASRLGPGGLVVSVEPNPLVFIDLCRNINRNLQNCLVIPLNIGLSDRTASTKITFDPEHSGISHITEHGSDAVPIAVVRWQDAQFLETLIGRREVLIKIDVEGAELKVLESIGSLLDKEQVRKIVMELDDKYLARYGGSKQAVYDLLKSYGFTGTRQSSGHYDEVFIRSCSDT